MGLEENENPGISCLSVRCAIPPVVALPRAGVVWGAGRWGRIAAQADARTEHCLLQQLGSQAMGTTLP